MTWFMVSIVRKTISGNAYYYARRSKRVDGKPRIVWRKYPGRAEEIVQALQGSKPEHAIVRESGAVAALYDIARQLHIVEHIDRHLPKRTDEASVGTYLLIAILNRCPAPCSKASIGNWFEPTILPNWLDVQEQQLTSQRFRDNMDRVSETAISGIERDIVATMVDRFAVDLRQVPFDATNFFTYIDSFNHRAPLAQRGHSKEGRKSLRIVGLALLVAADSNLPLLHSVYPRNQPAAPTFSSLLDALAARWRELYARHGEDITLVFDKGANSAANLAALEEGPYRFGGSLVPNQHPELLAVPNHRLQPLDGIEGARAWRTRHTVYGAERTVLVTWNRNLFDAQAATLLREGAKRRPGLRELQMRLRRWRRGTIRRGRPPTLEGTRKKVEAWLAARRMADLFRVQLKPAEPAPRLTFRFDRKAWQKPQDSLLGKTLIVTDDHHWSNLEIVRGYRALHHVENAFRNSQDSSHIAIRPQCHWTDQKIRVHVFCCVLALMLCSLLQRETRQHSFDLSGTNLLDTLANVREVGILQSTSRKRSKPALEITLSQMSETEKALDDSLNLARFRSTQVTRPLAAAHRGSRAPVARKHSVIATSYESRQRQTDGARNPKPS